MQKNFELLHRLHEHFSEMIPTLQALARSSMYPSARPSTLWHSGQTLPTATRWGSEASPSHSHSVFMWHPANPLMLPDCSTSKPNPCTLARTHSSLQITGYVGGAHELTVASDANGLQSATYKPAAVGHTAFVRVSESPDLQAGLYGIPYFLLAPLLCCGAYVRLLHLQATRSA